MDIHKILLQYWGYTTFRPMQEDIILSVMKGQDTLALLPTGGGKSICYQVPALAMEGICLVVSPLIALMKDQVEQLKARKIKAFAIYSGMHFNEIEVALNNAVYGDAKLLYVSPERLASRQFREVLQYMKVNFVAVDEAHCISQWGYDFRPPYLQIAEIRDMIPKVPILAVTASATPEVVDDIQEKLNFREKRVIRQSFERENLAYVVLYEEDKNGRIINMFNKVPGSAIVYAGTRRRTYDFARFLVKNGISAEHYHAGLSNAERDQKQQNWMKGKTRVIVATNAFGMGIDKPDVRLVVHVDLPGSPEAYFQEAGRAGRDLKKSWAAVLYQDADLLDAEKQFESSFPEMDTIRRVYQALGNYLKLALGSGQNLSFDFDISNFSHQYNFEPVVAYSALKFLEKEGYLILTEGVHNPPKIHFKLQGEDLYRFRVEHPKLDGFVKLILRLYTGLFSQFVKISLTEISNKTKLSTEKIAALLEQLDHLEVVNYIPPKSKPQIIMTIERLDSKDLYLAKENYDLRKQIARKRLDALKDYLTNKRNCRSLFLLSYFGETGKQRCGKCDVCLERNKAQISKAEFDNVLSQIKPLLMVKPVKPEELFVAINNFNAEKSKRVVEWLLDNDKIYYTPDKKLSWKNK
ncbi:MAG: RecQ family ATP-dependent DNA helicase [Bacteroidales bacterium]|nr:RecQ family ATP-dependent DNA helicase [Bacteroidales bacterium]